MTRHEQLDGTSENSENKGPSKFLLKTEIGRLGIYNMLEIMAALHGGNPEDYTSGGIEWKDVIDARTIYGLGNRESCD